MNKIMSKRVSFGGTAKTPSKIPTALSTRSESEKAERKSKMAGSTNQNPFSIRKFDGTNFTVWKAQIKSYMTIKDCKNAINTVKPTEKKAAQEWEDEDNVAKAIILLSLNDEQASLI